MSKGERNHLKARMYAEMAAQALLEGARTRTAPDGPWVSAGVSDLTDPMFMRNCNPSHRR